MFKQIRRRARGFTLIELMIVVVVIAILAAVAFPSYLEQTRKSKRAQGKAKLVEVSQKLERFFTDNGRYADTPTATTITALGPLYGLASGASVYAGDNNDPSGPYVVTAAAGATGTPQTSFTLTATRNGTFTDTKCGDLTLTSTGVKGMTGGTDTTVSDCW